MRKIGLLLIVIALLVSACGGEPIAAPTTLPALCALQPSSLSVLIHARGQNSIL